MLASSLKKLVTVFLNDAISLGSPTTFAYPLPIRYPIGNNIPADFNQPV